jgi:hypothetical protein
MAAAPAAPTGSPIEALFRPSTRFRDSHALRYALPYGFTEVELLPGLTIENVLATGVTWGDFLSFVRGKLVWMTPDVYVCPNGLDVGRDTWVLVLGVPGGASMFVHVAEGTPATAATVTCDFMVRLLATSEEHGVYIRGSSYEVSTPLSGAALSISFQESRDSLREVLFHGVALSADLCHALATMSRLDMELEMRYCRLADDAAVAFVDCLHSGRGPIKLISCEIDSQTMAHALTGNTRVTRLKPDFGETNDAEMAVVFAALANNSGLVELDLYCCYISDDNWSSLCQSLQAHPTLTSLGLRNTLPRPRIGGRIALTADQKAHRTRLLADMVQRNTVLHNIQLSEDERDEEIYTGSILPYLETNLYRPRVLAVKKTKERPFREKMLGRALASVKTNANLVWMFLSENVDAFARTEEDEDEERHSIEVPVAVAAAVVAVAEAGSKRKR